MQMVRAVVAGVAGAIAMSIASLIFGELGIAVSFEGLLGTLLGFEPNSQAGMGAGFMLHLMIGGWFAVLYAQGFERLSIGGWSVGAAFSIAHIFVAAFLVAVLAFFLSPAATGGAYPAAFMAHQGLAGVCTFMLLHITYGAVVGAVYNALTTPVYIGSDSLAQSS